MATRIETRTVVAMTALMGALIGLGHATQLVGRHRKRADTTADTAEIRRVAREVRCTVYVGGVQRMPWSAVVSTELIRMPHAGTGRSLKLELACGHVRYQKRSQGQPRRVQCRECPMEVSP